ncbi:MAG: tRNA lysidine(34) synthetase TilS C-terminal domain-containing protein, partial [Christensenellales bacterium]
TPERLRGVPLLCTDNEILFVPGYTVAERVRVTAESKRIIYIKLEEDLGFERQELHDGGH